MTVPLAVYGSLRRGLALPYQPPDLDRLLGDRGPCLIAGRLVDLGAYPGLVGGQGQVVADLCGLPDEATLAVFDDYEGYDPDQPVTSRYLRIRVRLIEPGVDAWTYLYNQAWTPEMLVGSGDWHRHVMTRSPG
ncbi:MAG: gamma-glutamylcyclotransferase [Actinomycetota bacterium]|nr:gamma-glutamylcyclotransferase [Actinomycetota bacterium]